MGLRQERDPEKVEHWAGEGWRVVVGEGVIGLEAGWVMTGRMVGS